MAYTPLVFTGPVRDTARCGRSAIEKRQTEGVIALSATGLAGDEQAEKAFTAALTVRCVTIPANTTTTGK